VLHDPGLALGRAERDGEVLHRQQRAAGCVLLDGAHADAPVLTRGSMAVYSRSTTMLPTITKNADSRVTAMMTGWSLEVIESAVSFPTPLMPNTFSVMTAPPRRPATSMPKMVTIGVSAGRGACRR